MMRELWRVLADGGRMIVVAPNRRGLWARFDPERLASEAGAIEVIFGVRQP